VSRTIRQSPPSRARMDATAPARPSPGPERRAPPARPRTGGRATAPVCAKWPPRDQARLKTTVEDSDRRATTAALIYSCLQRLMDDLYLEASRIRALSRPRELTTWGLARNAGVDRAWRSTSRRRGLRDSATGFLRASVTHRLTGQPTRHQSSRRRWSPEARSDCRCEDKHRGATRAQECPICPVRRPQSIAILGRTHLTANPATGHDRPLGLENGTSEIDRATRRRGVGDGESAY
jgi:hypothetical protein